MEQALLAAGVDVTIATTDDDGRGRSAARVSIAPLDRPDRFCARKWIDRYTVAPALVPWLWTHVPAFDVVHIHALFSFPSTVAAWIARAHAVPYVVRPLGTLSSFGMTARRPLAKQASLCLNEAHVLRGAAAVHFTSEIERLEAEALNVAMRSVVIPLGLATPAAGDRHRLFSRHPELTGRRVVLFLSRLDPKKNLEALLAALVDIAQPHGDVALLVAGVGDPAYERHLRQRAEHLGIAPRVVWAGHLDGADKADAFAAADVFALPSLSENFGIAAIEAMSSGCACVVGRGVGDAATWAGEGAAVAVPPEREALAGAIIRLLDDDAARHALGQRAKSVAQTRYGSEAMGRSLLDLYQRIAPTDVTRAA